MAWKYVSVNDTNGAAYKGWDTALPSTSLAAWQHSSYSPAEKITISTDDTSSVVTSGATDNYSGALYGFPIAETDLDKLEFTFKHLKISQTEPRKLYVYNQTTSAWVELDSNTGSFGTATFTQLWDYPTDATRGDISDYMDASRRIWFLVVVEGNTGKALTMYYARARIRYIRYLEGIRSIDLSSGNVMIKSTDIGNNYAAMLRVPQGKTVRPNSDNCSGWRGEVPATNLPGNLTSWNDDDYNSSQEDTVSVDDDNYLSSAGAFYPTQTSGGHKLDYVSPVDRANVVRIFARAKISVYLGALGTLYLRIWNHTTSSWDLLDSVVTSYAGATYVDTLSGLIKSDISDYIDASGNVYTLVYPSAYGFECRLLYTQLTVYS